MTSTVLFVPLEDTYPVNSVEDFSIRSKLHTTKEILKYFETVNERILQDLRFHSDFFIKNIYPQEGQSYYILTTSSRIKDPTSNLRTTDDVCIERINHLDDRRAIVKRISWVDDYVTDQAGGPQLSWTLDPFTGEYLLGILANKQSPKSSLKYYGGFTCDNWNTLIKEPRCIDHGSLQSLQSQQGWVIGAYSLLLALKSIGVKMGELSWANLSVNQDATIKVGNFTRGSYQLPNGIVLQTGEILSSVPLGKRVLALMLINDKIRPYLLNKIQNFFQDFSGILRDVMSILPENRLAINVDSLLQHEMNDNTPEIEIYLRRCI